MTDPRRCEGLNRETPRANHTAEERSRAEPRTAWIAADWHGSVGLLTHAPQTPIFWLAFAGFLTAWYLYVKRPDIPETIQKKFSGLHSLLVNKYYMDDLYIKGFASGCVSKLRTSPTTMR